MEVRALRKSQTALRIISRDGWRGMVVLLNKKMGNLYLNFTKDGVEEFLNYSKSSLEELGIAAHCSGPRQVSGYELDMTVKKQDITSADTIIDMGCGKGAAMVTLAKYPFRRIAGVEISPKLVGIARKNLSRLLLRRKTKVFCSDAATFTDLDEYTYIYFFNPFSRTVMRSVMDNVRSSLHRRPRKVTIIYNNPVSHGEILSGEVFEWVAEHKSGERPSVNVYCSRPRSEQAPSSWETQSRPKRTLL